MNGRNENHEKDMLDKIEEAPIKRVFDMIYDLIMANVLFILFNLHIPLFLVFFIPGNVAMYFIILGILCLNVLPSYGAILYALDRRGDDETSHFKKFMDGYRENFKVSFLTGLMGILFMLVALLDGIFFLSKANQAVYMAFLVIFFVGLLLYVASAPIIVHFGLKPGKAIKITLGHFFKLIPGALLAILVAGFSVYISRYIVFPLIVGFSLAGLIQETLSKKALAVIENGNLLREER